MAARYTQADYQAALLALLPRGRVWPKEPDSGQSRVAGALAGSFERLDARSQALLVDAFPATALELLPEWESTLGLPDDCEGDDQTLQQRRAQVVTRFAGGGGQSVAYYIDVLERLGFEANVQEFAPFRAGASTAGSPIATEDWWFVWQVNLVGARVFYFSAGVSAAGEALVTIADGPAPCVIEALKPAHTSVLFASVKPGVLDFEDADNSDLIAAL